MKMIPLLVLSLLLSGATQAHSRASTGAANSPSTPRQKLKEYVDVLQNTPDDVELRQKIVKLAATLKPPPAIPEEARRYYVKAVAIQKDAKTPEEAALAVNAYQQALLLAPWWADGYYNMSSALRLAGRYEEATTALKLYLASNPKDARAAQDRIYAIEGEQERAAAEQTARTQKEAEEKAQQQAAQQRRKKEETEEQARQQAELQRQKMRHFLEDLHNKAWRVAQTRSTRDALVKSVTGYRGLIYGLGPVTQLGIRELQLPGNGTVVVVFNEPYLKRIVGTPKSPSLDQISWQCVWAEGNLTPAFSQAVTNVNGEPEFLVSCDDNDDGSQHVYQLFYY
jgi:hypothetical protein